MGHGHGHGHGGSDGRKLTIALAITATVLISGAVGAVVTGSLALLADLGHQVTDVAALIAAVVAARLAQRPPSTRRTFGLGRAEVLGAALNALALLAVTVWVAIEAFERLGDPTPVPGLGLLMFGAIGLVGNLVALLVLSRGAAENMNVRGAALHVLGDALGSVAVLVAAAVTLTTGWVYADTVASLAIVAILVPRTVALLREASHLLLEGAPAGIDVEEVRSTLLALPGVEEVHDLHVWAINDRNPAVSAHLVIGQDGCATADCGEHGVLDAATAVLEERFALHHSTLQVEAAAHAAHESACVPPEPSPAVSASANV
ncbi:cation diffusion facilitator family transporter [Actinomycetospora sp. DW7H6]|uniref:Cation diffusion facilitator family transporter n=2 Tax=Actinomycetospora lemnae TaxID=3019891 RepID=A0ABT5SY26_9PSEU|nr:cation diffusion facilitator family transporter [Actinomycetospora sp. DW7H6]MDD7967768.1 cation diffusion facilitator family transporter [Actinomycetospora sp. DW7H6]